jgi:anti-sigma B factor antagonist
VEISVKQLDQMTVVAITGSIDALTAGEVTNCLSAQIGGGQKQLVIDLGQVDFSSSAGVRVILAALRESRQHGGDLCLAAAQPGVEKVLKMSGLTSVLKTFTTVDEALAGFGSL